MGFQKSKLPNGMALENNMALTNKQLLQLLKDNLETFSLNQQTKDIFLILYTDSEYEPSCDIAESESELLYLLNEHEKMSSGDLNYKYRIVKLTKGE
jgi:hypothetical protein